MRDGRLNPHAAEQERYARVLDLCTRFGLVALIAAFTAYLLEWVPSHVPLHKLAELWSLPLAEYRAATGTPSGWGWLTHVPKGEFASLAGIALLAGCSLAGLGAILPLYWRRGDRVYAVICVAEIGLLLLAASGVLTGLH